MTIIKHKSQRVAVFIDTQNLYHSAKNLYHTRVNFANVVKEALSGRVLVRAMAYVIRTETDEEKGFFEALNKAGIETRVKDIRVFAGGAKKADWDIGLTIDAIAMAPKLDTVILATGDGDFVPLVEYLKYTQGCQVEVISFGKSTAQILRDVADDFIDMSDSPRNYLIGRFPQTARRGESRPATNSSAAPTDGVDNVSENIEFSGGEDPAVRMSGE